MPTLRDMLTPEVAAGLDRFIAAQEEAPTLPQAVSGILLDWLSGHGLVEVVDVPEGEDDPDASRKPRIA
ncbi:hypothetical protein [Methylobacterium haplocladii]|uniref:hypothetical protein n=1 Tax=Methylobacterium haplocladii TaxID=1176176 RepID=UPI001EDDED13|nr:hypothetical protein [Methylobacterium haplocladii]GJD82469.1 hypothetical protein HPGCJGGD_0325 [Methylobacterium haplocladii]GLS61165.1 hypothetical protein GCM10007887_38610 [Methylobacterium haplocladii]